MKALILALFLTCSLVLSAYEALGIKNSKGEGAGEVAQFGRGSAVAKDLVLTCNHVVEDYPNTFVKFGDEWVKCEVVARDKENDLALIKTPKKLSPVIDILDVPKLEVNGNHKTEPNRNELVSISWFVVDGSAFGFTEATDAPGISGAPCMAEGRLIGVVRAAERKRVIVVAKDGTLDYIGQGPVLLQCVGPEPIGKLIESYNGKH